MYDPAKPLPEPTKRLGRSTSTHAESEHLKCYQCRRPIEFLGPIVRYQILDGDGAEEIWHRDCWEATNGGCDVSLPHPLANDQV